MQKRKKNVKKKSHFVVLCREIHENGICLTYGNVFLDLTEDKITRYYKSDLSLHLCIQRFILMTYPVLVFSIYFIKIMYEKAQILKYVKCFEFFKIHPYTCPAILTKT